MAAQSGPQVWTCVTWQMTAQVWTPPHWVWPSAQVTAQVMPQVWIPPQWVCGPQVGWQVTPQVWTPPQ